MSKEIRRRRVRGDEVDLAVYEQGDPSHPTVLLVHGYPDTHAVWDEVAGRLAARFHVVRYDVRGAGASSRPSGRERYAFAHLMADLRAVLEATAPGREVHLVGHDWGSIQSWEAVCTMPERFASFTSISGPCLDHVAHWTRRNLTRPTPRRLARSAGQALRSWYIYLFQTPLLPELMWRSGLSGPFGRALEIGERVPRRPGHPARTLPRDGAAGVGLYRANMAERLRRPRDRRTDVPTQIIVPTRDLFVSPHLVGAAAGHVPHLSLRPIAAGHWVPRSHPGPVARWITEHATAAAGGTLTPAESRALRRARVRPGRRPFEASLVVVTGAGGGIGRATALAFAERGAEVIAADLDPDTARHTADLAVRLGGAAHPYRIDVADRAAMEEFAATVRKRHGVPDVVVNNAGIGMAGAFLDHSAEDWRRVLDVNLWGVIHGSRLFGAQMAERGEGGHIVNTASAAAYTPSRMLPAYATSKAAVLMLSECLRADLAGQGIGVSAICPGVVDTGITRTATFVGAGPEKQEERRRRAARAYGLRGYGPEGVAERIVAAVREDIALVPVTPEARAGHLGARLSPRLMRLFARIDAG
ncbi:SDR family oxidoreductase [Actinomadura viridis]|uniref:NAD(P)-dependent dehydrogenase (Short-subunit alcohol dehydrogenase family)/pimeloyl-ACP methyl ester carboxylesterase n=1 Tax=Actinomadura viridis TaxID=58110 RepID=A0A931DNX7_9ACTN|nr:SDR family oxidoreductase [Actinomadura viridis]MBG6090083.1 NAD(P)-dependent dehydrogenase (short-subunit alcohol dehydrogenase family)/pimeloyl-ACP methyl ester carboxylesterase [Actinomadura viridis]